MAKITLRQFLGGEPLKYKGFNGRTHWATYDSAVGIQILREKKPKISAVADGTRDRRRAAAFYHNVTRRNPNGDDEEASDD